MLCENNDAGMFVTAFIGYLDVPSGRLRYANAGHNPPLIRQGGSFGWLPVRPGLVLAGLEDTSYIQDEITLAPDDILCLYTDGVTEAESAAAEFFGEDRLLAAAEKYRSLSSQAFTQSILAEIDSFAAGIEQADDITLLVLRYHGAAKG
jgi:sigma-B regulation protein RsbU (phosphoserine phosphatase)